jgi:hypothetical protein
MKFFTVLRFYRKKCPKPDRPTDRPVSQLARFLQSKTSIFSIHLRLTVITVKKIAKSLKIKGLRLYGSLYGGFTVALRFYALLLKTYDNKAPPTPPLAQHHNKTVENQALHDAN